ncbi:MAG: hypothetical protein HY690_06900 [Chloroflexi bacterium]|nr:hypothetical protein [Chloroflexota bacterium]
MDALTAQVEALTARVEALTAQVEALTARMDALTAQVEALTARVDALAAQVEALTARVDALTAQVEALTARVDALAEAQARTERKLEALIARVEALTEVQENMNTRLGRVEGEMLEQRYRTLGPVYFGRLAARLRGLAPADFVELLEQAVEQGVLAEHERESLLVADVVLAGRRRADRVEVYLLAEVSVGIGAHDVERAADRAALLEKLGRPTIPVVAGRSINAEAAVLARERGVWSVLDGRTIPPTDS